MSDKKKQWMNMTPSQLAEKARSMPVGAPETPSIPLVGITPAAAQRLQEETVMRMTAALQPLVDKTTGVEEQTLIIGAILGFAIGTARQAGLSDPEILAAVAQMAKG